MKETFVWVTTSFEGFHKWPDAPANVSFLQDKHRHIFHVKVGVAVKHNNRDVEFFQFKKQVEGYVDLMWKGKTFTFSCEMIAEDIMKRFDAAFVEVSEDGENGALVMER